MSKFKYKCKDCSHFGEHTLRNGAHKVGCEIIDCDGAYPIAVGRDCTTLRCRKYSVKQEVGNA